MKAGRWWNVRLFLVGLLVLMAIPLTTLSFTQVFGQQASSEEVEEEEIALATGRASVSVVQPGRAIVTARGNHFVVDSPTPLGGPNESMNPLDAFLAGMLTCAVFIYETAAQEMDIPLESISASIEADFGVQGLIDGSVDPRIRAFRIELDLEGVTADEADLLREQYMMRCPLYTTLIRSAPIDVVHVGLDDVAMDHGDGAPPGPTVVHRVDLPIEDAESTLGIVQMKLAFEPGSWTPPHVHGGQTIVTVLDGEITNNTDDVETTYSPGTGWTEQPNVPHMAGNDTDEIGHVIVTVALPEDAAMTTMVEGMVEGELPPGPVALMRGEMEATDVPEEFTLVQLALDFAPGAWTPLHVHGGDALVTVLEGEMTRSIDGVEETFAAGESWFELANVPHAAGNDTDEHARVSVTFILPIGAALTTVVEE